MPFGEMKLGLEDLEDEWECGSYDDEEDEEDLWMEQGLEVVVSTMQAAVLLAFNVRKSLTFGALEALLFPQLPQSAS